MRRSRVRAVPRPDAASTLRIPCQGEAVRTEQTDLLELSRYAFGRLWDRVQRLMEEIQRSEGSIASLKRELTPPRY